MKRKFGYQGGAFAPVVRAQRPIFLNRQRDAHVYARREWLANPVIQQRRLNDLLLLARNRARAKSYATGFLTSSNALARKIQLRWRRHSATSKQRLVRSMSLPRDVQNLVYSYVNPRSFRSK